MTHSISQILISRHGLHAGLAQIAGTHARIKARAARRGRVRGWQIPRAPRSAAGRFDRFIATILAAIAGAKLHRLSTELSLRGVRYERTGNAASSNGGRR
ncbi:hypothetical protein HNR60_002916 [Rhodopseudomonas rhenobacensis]|uniref:Uncharacterized protein n=1 Tax=Rhodopseudomonas rhenobacensis TaxID=87461 RepID=A0A7W8DZA7_9BRAD|nr:hypothetical protein [Rhodopseudomonas rhenobacensis]MBB5048154.1 hypothetical protein [Rhodopseudomonas rhenobacensis]